ncbi:ly6/PLAUR domain-containing protein 2-like [Archocentrus centrarchus]|uniref:ly6/PLAUR domain-containing protein 2-like n=1 Tax=Archocentrus centrarchus TaxID=63155 RepID=UPI0011EA3A61|nr:ly6/PLAUR domain-containing protein 2-like [Archocentrus centrarchus]
MKVCAFALLLLVAATYGEALQCLTCVHEAPDSGDCEETLETCPPEMDACAKVTYPAPDENTFHKSCFKMLECLKLGVTEGLKVTCCNWDSCNK